MIYKGREVLAIVEQDYNEKAVSFDRLERMIVDKPSNVIYFERNGKLYGIITMGDVIRDSCECREKVAINTNFTTLSNSEYMRARNIFNEKKNINNLPIVDEKGILTGEWSRWDDVLCNAYISAVVKGKAAKCMENYHVAVVDSDICSNNKYGGAISLGWIYKLLQLSGAEVECIGYDSVSDYLNKVDYILFLTEDEYRAFNVLYCHLHKTENAFKLQTVYKIFGYMNLKEHLDTLKRNGVYVYNLTFEQNKYYMGLKNKIDEKFKKIGKNKGVIIPSEIEKDFFDDLYTADYAAGIKNIDFQVETESGKSMLKDCRSEYYNVVSGERVTCGCPKKYKKTIYFIGPCFIYGRYVEDKNTIESILQTFYNESGYQVRVVNCGSVSYEGPEHIDLEMTRIMDLPLKAGDILLIYLKGDKVSVPEINLMDVLETKDVNVEWMLDNPMHCNHKINAMYAEAICEALRPVLLEGTGKSCLNKNCDFIRTLYIDRYFQRFNPHEYNKIGAIVMNCNPFTFGHRYLIEQAIEKVDFLIIFVVEENRSTFSFLERFAMVSEGTADLENVMAAPSGPYILSQTTFPEYFVKAADEDLIKNTENDITIFAEKIAQHLNIKYRFVGEEPEDAVTSQYNDAMKKILPEHGIELIEIPRKEQDGRYISASFARELLEDNNIDAFKEFVPQSTMRVLFQK